MKYIYLNNILNSSEGRVYKSKILDIIFFFVYSSGVQNFFCCFAMHPMIHKFWPLVYVTSKQWHAINPSSPLNVVVQGNMNKNRKYKMVRELGVLTILLYLKLAVLVRLKTIWVSFFLIYKKNTVDLPCLMARK